ISYADCEITRSRRILNYICTPGLQGLYIISAGTYRANGLLSHLAAVDLPDEARRDLGRTDGRSPQPEIRSRYHTGHIYMYTKSGATQILSPPFPAGFQRVG